MSVRGKVSQDGYKRFPLDRKGLVGHRPNTGKWDLLRLGILVYVDKLGLFPCYMTVSYSAFDLTVPIVFMYGPGPVEFLLNGDPWDVNGGGLTNGNIQG